MPILFQPLTREERAEDFVEKAEEAYSLLIGPPESITREDIKALQRIWKKWGYYEGEIDGIWGPLTERAYHRWKEVMELQEKINDVLEAFGEPSIKVDGLLGKETRAGIKKAQRWLKDAGLYKGKVDGIWGPLTERAYEELMESGFSSSSELLRPASREERAEVVEERAEESRAEERVDREVGETEGESEEGGEVVPELSSAPSNVEERVVVEKLAEKAQEKGEKLLGTKAPVLVVYIDNPAKGAGVGYLYDSSGKLIKKIPISFSPRGLGFTPGSGQTPTGLLFVNTYAKPQPGHVVKMSSITKTPVWEVVWSVHGLEEENANTARRSIAFHGVSPRSQWKVGERPASAGCYVAKSEDLVLLYKNAVPTERGRGFLMVVYSPYGPKTAFIEEALGLYAAGS